MHHPAAGVVIAWFFAPPLQFISQGIEVTLYLFRHPEHAYSRALLEAERVDAFRFRGTRFDCGTHIGLIEATIRYALDNEKLSDAARELMQNALGEMGVVET